VINTILDEPNRLQLLLEKWCLGEYPELRGKCLFLCSHPNGQYIGNACLMCIELRPYDMWGRQFGMKYKIEPYFKEEDFLKGSYVLIDVVSIRALAGTDGLKDYFLKQLKPALDEMRELVGIFEIMKS
jgi:hypothetical protein